MLKGFCDRCQKEMPMTRAVNEEDIYFRLAESEYESNVVTYMGKGCVQVRYKCLNLCEDCANELYEMNRKFMEGE